MVEVTEATINDRDSTYSTVQAENKPGNSKMKKDNDDENIMLNISILCHRQKRSLLENSYKTKSIHRECPSITSRAGMSTPSIASMMTIAM